MQHGTFRWVIGTVLVVALILGGYWVLSDKGVSVPGTSGQQGVPPSGAIGGGNCPDTGVTTPKIRLEDKGASTTTYVSGSTCYLTDSDGIIVANVTTSSGGFANAENVPCPGTYQVDCVTQAGVAGSASGTIVGDGAEARLTLETNQLEYLQMRFKDIVNDDFEYLIIDGATSGTNTSAFSTINSTAVIEASGTTTDIAVGTDGTLEFTLQLKTATANKYLGGPNDQCYLLVDVGSDNEWMEPTISRGGVAISDSYNAIDSDSKDDSTINNADYAYMIGTGDSIRETLSEIDGYIKAKSGADPDTTNDDLGFSILCEGTYKSSDKADTIQTGLASDASTPVYTNPATAYKPYFVVYIS